MTSCSKGGFTVTFTLTQGPGAACVQASSPLFAQVAHCTDVRKSLKYELDKVDICSKTKVLPGFRHDDASPYNIAVPSLRKIRTALFFEFNSAVCLGDFPYSSLMLISALCLRRTFFVNVSGGKIQWRVATL